MKSKKSPTRQVPVLTDKPEAILSAITYSKQFTLDAALARAAGAVRLSSMHDTLGVAVTAMHSKLEPKKI
jgi:hypothetical protein